MDERRGARIDDAAGAITPAPLIARLDRFFVARRARGEAQQQVNANAGHGKHRNLDQRVEAAKVHHNRADDVGGIRQRFGDLLVVRRDQLLACGRVVNDVSTIDPTTTAAPIAMSTSRANCERGWR